MARPETVPNLCRPDTYDLSKTIKVQTEDRHVIDCEYRGRPIRAGRWLYPSCSIGGGICDGIRNPVPITSPVIKPGFVTSILNWLNRQQTNTYIKEMETYHPLGSSLLPEARKGLFLGLNSPWKEWKKEASLLAPHLYDSDPTWQQKIEEFRQRPGGKELLAKARENWANNQPIIWIHPDGT